MKEWDYMKKSKIIISLLILFSILSITTLVFAEASNGSQVANFKIDLPKSVASPPSTALDDFFAPLIAIQEDLSGPVAQGIVMILIAVTGYLIAFGEQSGLAKTFINIVFGAAIILQVSTATNFFTYFGFQDINPNTIDYSNSQVAADNAKFLSSMNGSQFNLLGAFGSYFSQAVQNGAGFIKPFMFKLVGLLVVIEITLSMALGLVRDDKIRYLLSTVLKIGFYIFLIENWIKGTYHITNSIFNGFQTLGYIASGVQLNSDMTPDSLVTSALNVISSTFEQISSLGITSFPSILAGIIVMAGVIVTTFLTAIEMLMCRLEFYVISIITMMLLPFGLNKHTNFLTEKAIGAVFSSGIKVATISFIGAIGSPMLISMMANIQEKAQGDLLPQFTGLLQLLLACFLLYMLVKRVPQLAQGLISGNPSLAGSSFVDTMKSGAAKAVTAATGTAQYYGMLQQARNMEKGDLAGGGKMGTLKNIGKLAQAKAFAPYDRGMDSMRSALERRKTNAQMQMSFRNKKGWKPWKPVGRPDVNIDDEINERLKNSKPNNDLKKAQENNAKEQKRLALTYTPQLPYTPNDK